MLASRGGSASIEKPLVFQWFRGLTHGGGATQNYGKTIGFSMVSRFHAINFVSLPSQKHSDSAPPLYRLAAGRTPSPLIHDFADIRFSSEMDIFHFGPPPRQPFPFFKWTPLASRAPTLL